MHAILCRILAIIWPQRCVCCGELVPPQQPLCAACQKNIPVVRPPTCPFCGQEKKICNCRKRRSAFDSIAAPFYYESAVQSGMLRLKRYDDPIAVAFFAEHMATVARREYGNEHIDGVVYVPMTKRAFRARDYNQGELLAKAVAQQLHLPVYAVLEKLYETAAQKQLDPRHRSGNVLGVFEVIDPAVVKDKTLLLVDDVFTTGATLHECAKMLKIYGARRVLALTAAVHKTKEPPKE